MHEMSIAEAIWDLARRHVPEGGVLRAVRLRAGPMRGIDPPSMQWAWQALMHEHANEKVLLEMESLPWRMKCGGCGTEWTAAELAESCICGSDRVRPIGGDELQLVSIEVDDEPAVSETFESSAPTRQRN